MKKRIAAIMFWSMSGCSVDYRIRRTSAHFQNHGEKVEPDANGDKRPGDQRFRESSCGCARILAETVGKDTAALPSAGLKDANTTLERSLQLFIRATGRRIRWPLSRLTPISSVIAMAVMQNSGIPKRRNRSHPPPLRKPASRPERAFAFSLPEIGSDVNHTDMRHSARLRKLSYLYSRASFHAEYFILFLENIIQEVISMELTPTTKVNDLLNRYPFLKDFLISLSPEFKMLDNPVMRKTLGRVASLNKAAFDRRMDVKKLLDDLAAEIKKQTNETVTVSPGGPREDEQEMKIEALKNIIKELHSGKAPEALKEKFHDLIKDVAPWEIAQMEQRLIAEGMPATEIKNLCEVHVQVFKEALEHKSVPGLPAGHPVHTYMLENRAAEGILKQLGEINDYVRQKDVLLGHIDKLAAIDKHYLRKENQLFPLVEEKGITGPSKVMWALHDDIRHFIKDVRKRATDEKMERVAIDALVKMVNDMIYKEEHIMFPMALETLSEDEWGKAKKGEEEIGFAWIEPEAEWKPAGATFQQTFWKKK